MNVNYFNFYHYNGSPSLLWSGIFDALVLYRSALIGKAPLQAAPAVYISPDFRLPMESLLIVSKW